MSKRTRTLILGVTLAAMNLAGLIGVAQAQTSDYPASSQDARRPPTEGHVGQPYRYYHDALAAQTQPTSADDIRRPPTEAQVGESWRHPANVPVQAAASGGQSGWLVLTLGVLSAALALVAGLAVLAARRASRRLRTSHAA